MWVFTYGSLMSDGWEQEFACKGREVASLLGHRRAFIKRSVRNWGTSQYPCPTLALVEDHEAECLGVAFQFAEEQRSTVRAYLADREGRSFSFPARQIRLVSGSKVQALVSVIDKAASTYMGELSVADRARLVTGAVGTDGTCLDYVKRVRRDLAEVGVVDPTVERFWDEVVTA